MADSSQKFIARNRAPRVQIEYDVELYGAEKKVQLPFVMGVMSDLLGKSKESQPAIADRKFLEIDVDNFDSRMKSLAPRAAFSVPNTLTGEGNMAIDLTFESMADFSPGAIAGKVDALRPLLEARNQLQTLMAYMDGKSGAEDLIERILQDPALLTSLANTSVSTDQDQSAALDSLRLAELPSEEPDTSSEVLADLASKAPVEEEVPDSVADTLASLSQVPSQTEKVEDDTADVLASLSASAPASEKETPAADAALASLRDVEVPMPAEEPEATEDVLAELVQSGVDLGAEEEIAQDRILDDLALSQPEEADPEALDPVAGILEGLERVEFAPEVDSAEVEQVLDGLPDVTEEDPADSSEGADDVLANLAGQETEALGEPEEDPDLAQLLGDLEPPEQDAPAGDDTASVLDSLAEFAPPNDASVQEETADEVLAQIAQTADELSAQVSAGEELDSVLAGLETVEETDAQNTEEDLQELLGGLTSTESEEPDGETELDDILAGLDSDDGAEPQLEPDQNDVLAELSLGAEEVDTQEGEGETEDALDSLLADLDLEPGPATEEPEEEDLGSLLADLASDDSAEEEIETDAEPSADEIDLDDLLGDLDGANAPETAETEPEAAGEATELDALLSGLDSDDPGDSDDGLGDLDDLLADLDADLEGGLENENTSDPDEQPELAPPVSEEVTTSQTEPEFAYGTISANRPSPEQLTRRRFRIALMGDFSGRSAKGLVETGAALAARKPIVLDPDTVEDVIESFASDLVLPIGKEGAGISVKLGELDDLHPDELFDNVDLFADLVSLRKQLQSGVTVEHASKTLAAWAAEYGTPVRVPKRQSAGSAVPADRRLSAFQQLIGDQENSLREPSPIEELMARIVGPHIRALPDPNVASMQKAVDDALTDAMRLVLHHPEFQAIEAQWRSLDLIARSVEVDDTLEVVLYDISAEELAADLAAQDDLTESGFTKLLTEEPMDAELGRGGYSALIGFYAFEETPPHAELLGRIARVAAHVDAPFFASLGPDFLKLDKKDRPPLVAQAWDTLQSMPEAGHLGLASPRFLLRRPYGAKTDPVDAFDFEEFSESEGLRGMLWGNPVVLVTILLARSFKAHGPSMQLGSIMSLGDMPYHTVYDQFGDQVALPCTERNIDLDKIAIANERGIMAVSAVKGRDEVRLTSFASVKGGEVLGPWTGVPAPEPSPADPRETKGPSSTSEDAETMQDDSADFDLDDLGLDDLDFGAADESETTTDDDLGELDDLLASFSDDDDTADEGDEDEMDAELAALLADL